MGPSRGALPVSASSLLARLVHSSRLLSVALHSVCSQRNATACITLHAYLCPALTTCTDQEHGGRGRGGGGRKNFGPKPAREYADVDPSFKVSNKTMHLLQEYCILLSGCRFLFFFSPELTYPKSNSSFISKSMLFVLVRHGWS